MMMMMNVRATHSSNPESLFQAKTKKNLAINGRFKYINKKIK